MDKMVAGLGVVVVTGPFVRVGNLQTIGECW